MTDTFVAAEVENRRPLGSFGTIVTFVILAVLALMIVFPFIWMLFTSLKPEAEIAVFPPQLLPRTWTFENYENVWTRIPFARLFLNSIAFAGGVTIVSLLLDSMSAYALARLDFPGRTV